MHDKSPSFSRNGLSPSPLAVVKYSGSVLQQLATVVAMFLASPRPHISVYKIHVTLDPWSNVIVTQTSCKLDGYRIILSMSQYHSVSDNFSFTPLTQHENMRKDIALQML